jgi:multidrug resistance protein, MATE family
MKESLLAGFWKDTFHNKHAESYSNIIFKYFLPEYVTALVLYSALNFLDAYYIGFLYSTSAHSAQSATNTLLHWFVKVGEAFSIGTVVICGMYNGAEKYKDAGRALFDTFWITTLCGLFISLVLFFGAPWIYSFMGTEDSITQKAIPFLRIKSVMLFFMYTYFAFVGFLRGIKNTRTPMNIFAIGAVLFVFFDYALIFGKFGLPELKLKGSATASLIQYVSMNILVMAVVLFNEEYKKYSLSLLRHGFNWGNIKRFVALSWPVMLDKSSIAIAYIWISKMTGPMGKVAVSSFGAIKELERVGFLPAIAFAQIVTFLASNDFGAKRYERVKPNIKRAIFLALIFVASILFIFSLNPKFIIKLFDRKNVFADFASKAFPLISIFVFFDVVQLILSGALRGIGQIQTVMWTRIFVVFCYFIPCSYLVANYSGLSWQVKFLTIYVMFYIGSGFMSYIFIRKFRSNSWKKAI